MGKEACESTEQEPGFISVQKIPNYLIGEQPITFFRTYPKGGPNLSGLLLSPIMRGAPLYLEKFKEYQGASTSNVHEILVREDGKVIRIVTKHSTYECKLPNSLDVSKLEHEMQPQKTEKPAAGLWSFVPKKLRALFGKEGKE